MLRFSILGFPVTVHWLFWLVMALFGGNLAVGRANPGLYVLIFVGVGFVSILVHEIGHALFQRKYGGQPSIMLYGLGGLAMSGGRFTRRESIIISAMGPIFGLALAAVAWRIDEHFVFGSAVVAWTVGVVLLVNLFWSLINLLPVPPLDGGRIMEALVRGPTTAAKVGVVVGAAASLFLLFYGSYFGAMLFGLLTYQNYQRARGLPTPLGF